MAKKNIKNKEIIVCPFCGEKYPAESGVCPNCHRTPYGESSGYTPMSEDKIKKIRWGIGIVLVAIFAVIYFVWLR